MQIDHGKPASPRIGPFTGLLGLWSTQLDILSEFRLETSTSTPQPEQLQRSNLAKVSAIADAQRRSTVRTDIGAAELLNIVLAAPGADPANLTAAVRMKERDAVAAAVTAMVAP
jgi:hypothetical protein